MEINNIHAKTSIAAAQESQLGRLANDAAVRADELKPLLDGGLKVTVAERNVLDDLQRVEMAEEPAWKDPLGMMIKDAFTLPPPEMPDFV